MAKDDTQEIGRSLVQLARLNKSPKSLLMAVLERHPEAKKKDVAHAAFRLMIDAADGESAQALQDVAITLRAAD